VYELGTEFDGSSHDWILNGEHPSAEAAASFKNQRSNSCTRERGCRREARGSSAYDQHIRGIERGI
jgi:hypothetical protein